MAGVQCYVTPVGSASRKKSGKDSVASPRRTQRGRPCDVCRSAGAWPGVAILRLTAIARPVINGGQWEGCLQRCPTVAAAHHFLYAQARYRAGLLGYGSAASGPTNYDERSRSAEPSPFASLTIGSSLPPSRSRVVLDRIRTRGRMWLHLNTRFLGRFRGHEISGTLRLNRRNFHARPARLEGQAHRCEGQATATAETGSGTNRHECPAWFLTPYLTPRDRDTPARIAWRRRSAGWSL